jgi:hypothetical protein
MKILEKLSPTEKNLKVIAKYFVEHEGCKDFICSNCPLYLSFPERIDCKIDAAGSRGEDFAIKVSEKWAIDYLEQLEKLKYLEKLT